MAKTVLLTGGSRGIGKATAALFREHGWEVTAPRRSELDFFDSVSVVNWKLPQHLRALVFCHGVWFSEHDVSSFALHGYFIDQYEMRVVLPYRFMLRCLKLIEDIECVVMVSSTRGLIGGVNTGPYAAACAAQIALMQGYAREYPGTRFNCVAPGLTDTDMGQQVIATGGAKPGAIAQPPEVVAAEIVWLVEDERCNGKIRRVVDGVASEVKWTW